MDLALVAMHLEPGPRAVPLGPAMLASALGRAFGASLATRVVDCFVQEAPEVCVARILEGEPRWVGLSMYLWNRGQALRIARLLKEARPGLIVFAGGAEATADPAGLRAQACFDFILPGEGEELIVATLAHLLAGTAPSAFVDGLRPAPVADLGSLPSPYLDGTLDPSAYSGMLWELSRGCPFKCDFCFEARGDAGLRRIPMARAQAELALFETRGVSQVFVLDPTFNYDRARAKDVLRLIQATAPAIHFFIEIRSEFVDREMARLFAAIRCTLQIGLQSADPAVLRKINRTLDREAFEAKVLLLHQAGATYGFDLIWGLPGDDLEGFRASLDFALGLAPNHLDLFPLAVLPGTRLMETAPSFGLEHLSDHPYLVTGSPSFGPEDMARAARLARACDVFYNEGKAVPWFALVQCALDLAPSAFFERFAEHLEAHPGDGPLDLQRGFLLALFQERGLDAQGGIAADFATWFGLSARLLEGTCETCTGAFLHDPELLLEQLGLGITELEDLSFVVPAQPCEARMRLEDGAVVVG